MSSSVAAPSSASTDGVRWVSGVVFGLAQQRFQSVAVACSLALPGLLALGTSEAYAQDLNVFQSVFPTQTRLGSLCSASGGVFNTSGGTLNSVVVTLTALPSGEFKNLTAFSASVTYTSLAQPCHLRPWQPRGVSILSPNWQRNYDITLTINGTNATGGFYRGSAEGP